MAGTLVVDTLKSSTTSAPTFQNTSGTQIGTLCMAWLSYNGATSTIRGSFNVSSITRNTTGDYTLNFTTALPDGNYAIAGNSGNPGTLNGYLLAPYGVAPTTTAARVSAVSTGAINTDMPYVYVAVFR